MIVDTSALISLLKEEPDAPKFERALAGATSLAISASSFLEAAIVTDSSKNKDLSDRLDVLIEDFCVDIVPFTQQQAKIARQAYQQFGRGSGHPARLNFGDCFAYALARDRDEPLLFKGNDFAQTDVKQAA